jgi:hypothetical protein
VRPVSISVAERSDRAAYRYQYRSTENTVIILFRNMWLSRDLNDVYLVNEPVLTEYMMRRLMSVSDLSELNFGKLRGGTKTYLLYPVLIL